MSSRSDRSAARIKRRSSRDKAHEALLKLAEEKPIRRQRRTEKDVRPLTKTQALYDQAISANVITISTGPAGAGKTWWAAMRAAKALDAGEIERIIVTRPAIEAGEELGFLPGELEEKYEPYFRPVRDALEEFLGSGPLEYHLKAGTIEARPLAYLRGATLKNAFVILDEAQNTTPTQMKLFLTRIGEETKVVVDGDLSQKDIKGLSGLEDALNRLRDVPGVGFVSFTRDDIVRSGICRLICDAYDA